MDALPEAGSDRYKQLATAASAWESLAVDMCLLDLHGDGVPVQGRMNQDSLDFLTVNVPSSSHFQLRVLFTCIEKMLMEAMIPSKPFFKIWSGAFPA